jgi:hypothetical protein
MRNTQCPEHLRFCEVVEIEGMKHIASCEKDSGKILFTPIKDLTERDTYQLSLHKAMCWPIPGHIKPHEGKDGQHIDFEIGHDKVKERFQDIAQRILRLLDASMYFQDERYPALILNFIFDSYFSGAFKYAPRLIIKGSTSSGKTRLQEILSRLSYRGYRMTQPTFSVVFRMIHSFGLTPIIDEIQSMDRGTMNELMQIYKCGDRWDGTIPRTNPVTFAPESFNVYAPMAISIRTGGAIADEIGNRAFIIKMIENRNKDIVVMLDDAEIDSIRTDLYSLYALWCINPDLFNFEDCIRETIHEICDCEKGTCSANITHDLRNRKKLMSRIRDIGIPYYTLAKLTHTDKEILEILYDEQDSNADRMKETLEGNVFHALMACVSKKKFENPLLNFEDIVGETSTNEIQNEFNISVAEQGNNKGKFEEIKTRRITLILDGMAFMIKRGSKNKSFIDINAHFKETFETNLEKYGSDEDREIYKSFQKRNKSGLTTDPLETTVEGVC